LDALRVVVEREFAADEGWLGVAPYSLATVPLEAFKAIATYARAQRLRLHTHVSTTAGENAACVAEYGRPPVALLAEHGLVDKRFTAIDAIHVSDDEVRLLGTARAAVGVCPISGHDSGRAVAPVEKLVAAGAGIALGSDHNGQIDLLQEARLLEYSLRTGRHQGAVMAPDAATALFHAATVTGARSLGATGGALEVGRPADFFTVNLFDPSIAGADPGSLLANVVFALERRAIREVWVGARQRLANGRHVNHGPIVGRFVDLQKRVWAV
jgi:formimidoylglutamate deiminase